MPRRLPLNNVYFKNVRRQAWCVSSLFTSLDDSLIIDSWGWAAGSCGSPTHPLVHSHPTSSSTTEKSRRSPDLADSEVIHGLGSEALRFRNMRFGRILKQTVNRNQGLPVSLGLWLSPCPSLRLPEEQTQGSSRGAVSQHIGGISTEIDTLTLTFLLLLEG